MVNPVTLADIPRDIFFSAVDKYGTPIYVYDAQRLQSQAARLRDYLPESIEILYSLKANSCLGICSMLANLGFGADVASEGELVTALEAGFSTKRLLVSGPYKSPETLSIIRSLQGVVVSIDSVEELELIVQQELPIQLILRLRPDYPSMSLIPMGSSSRFGIPFSELPKCRKYIKSKDIEVIGFHVFSGSQLLDSSALADQFQRIRDLTSRAADLLKFAPRIINFGGGFGVPYCFNDSELDLRFVGDELASISHQLAPTQIVIELGRYLVSQAGYYVTKVVGHQIHNGRKAAVVDGGTHQRADLCGLDLRKRGYPPFVLTKTLAPTLTSTDILGCLCFPDDVLAESILLPELQVGDLLAFRNAGAYGLSASPVHLLGHPVPAEIAINGKKISLIRERESARDQLAHQMHSLSQL